MPSWTLDENEKCIRKMTDYREYMETHTEDRSVWWTNFVEENRDYFNEVISNHNNSSAVGQHMDYLDEVTDGRRPLDKTAKKDHCYFEILPKGKQFLEGIFVGLYDVQRNSNVGNRNLSNKKNKPSSNSIEEVYLSKDDYELFECFFQYGDIERADLVFVGREEGLARESAQKNFEERLELFRSNNDGLGYIEQDRDKLGGFYVKDIGIYDSESGDSPFDQVMRYQTRIKYLLDHNFKLGNNLKKYREDVLHRPDSKTAMFDYFPLPKQGNFSYQLSEELPFTKRTYSEYQKSEQSRRKKLIKEMYDRYPMKVSWVYAGIENHGFRLQSVYEDLGFEFEEEIKIEPHEDYKDLVPRSNKISRFFKIGKRKGENQFVILTPFLGNRQINNDEVDAITTWVAAFLKK
ncbi:hypothetical protein PU629_03335 [Pullulanibacillus sp. KACC 23026]|uniref:hypothetical protein n=1 Tax=Pullulanibacillus sp. KACC 23026 TaxID=3028315 RepID=UPI0023B032F1|nr:hypothetical protein [Pullulanibacillus sp. KACC 23026]WEG13415.1 hypothetical protein PU629_03335 [Pullulanibacillus sp. KACC 23026]